MTPRSEPNAGVHRLLHVTTVPLTLRFIRGQPGYMRSHGLETSVLSSPGELLEEFGEQEGVPAYAVRMERRVAPIADAMALIRLVLRLRALRPTIVHAHTPKGGLLGIVAAWLTRVPVRIYHVHGLPFVTATGAKRRLLKWSERVACALADSVLCVSPTIRDLALAEGLTRPDKIRVPAHGSANGVDARRVFNPGLVSPDAMRAVRERHAIPPDAPVVGFVGRIVRDKGIAELAAAWDTLAPGHPRAHLVLVGPVETQDPVADEVLDRLRADPRVRLVGYVSDLAPLYAAMDVVVLPSYREGFPVCVIEAAAMGRPVVATRIPGSVDAVVEGRTGTLVAPRDAPALARAVGRYLDDPALRQAHAGAARERVLRDYRPGSIRSAVLEEYRRVMRLKGCPESDPVRSRER